MNETTALILFALFLLAAIVIAVRWFLKEYKDDDYVKSDEYLLDSFYDIKGDF